MAYSDESVILTTLLEGSVKVTKGTQQLIIKPGEVAVNNTTSTSLRSETADIDETMAWRNNMFVFNDQDIYSIMKNIARWYDVDVNYQGKFDGISVFGNYSRNKSLINLLKSIELTNKVAFKIEGRRVLVLAR